MYFKMSHQTPSSVSIVASLLILASILSSSSSMQLSDVDNRLCFTLCQCTSNTVDCNRQDKLSHIPSRILTEYSQLHIAHASFDNRGLTRANFSTITFLTSLKIVYSMLESMSDNTFSSMERLRYLDLSHNKFTMIAPRAFTGLQLTHLYLEQNQGGLQISEDMFKGLKVVKLYLRSNRISRIPVRAFEHLNIANLLLFNNTITTIDRGFEAIFTGSDKLLDLTKNPLHCSCALSWLPQLIRMWRVETDDVNITCQTPTHIQGSQISTLTNEKFSCETPSISKISVDVAESFIQLICHAKGGTSPQISWTQVNPTTGGETTSLSHQSYVAINISTLTNDNSFICRTWNEINASNQVIVKVNIVEDFFGKLKLHPQTIDGSNENIKSQIPRNPNPLPETHFLFTKQFSILQMIGAVVGTFTGVIVLIFIICCSQEHLMKKNSNIYWTTIPPDIKSSYNRVVSKAPPLSPSMAMVSSSNSQDYDIPQFHETNNFIPSFYTDRNMSHFVENQPKNYFSTVT